MLKTTTFAWVKNVYSLRTAGGTTGASLYTASLPLTSYGTKAVYNSPALTPSLHRFAPYLYTVIFGHFNLLLHHLYPQSTAPINMKKKLK